MRKLYCDDLKIEIMNWFSDMNIIQINIRLYIWKIYYLCV
jgi:hypothetical protein